MRRALLKQPGPLRSPAAGADAVRGGQLLLLRRLSSVVVGGTAGRHGGKPLLGT